MPKRSQSLEAGQTKLSRGMERVPKQTPVPWPIWSRAQTFSLRTVFLRQKNTAYRV
jgi:hypothetical protein